MWKNLYDSFLQNAAGKWATYLINHQEQECGRHVRDEFFNDIYPYSGLILICISLIATMLFYFYFNRKFGRYYKRGTWALWMLVTSLIIGTITFFMSFILLKQYQCDTFLLKIWISMINFIYAIIMFFILSIIFQVLAILIRKIFSFDISPMGNRTPF